MSGMQGYDGSKYTSRYLYSLSPDESVVEIKERKA